jgi:hypothetical protein
MRVIGLGAPDDLYVRFDAYELDALVEVLREPRADPTRDAAETYGVAPGHTGAVGRPPRPPARG